MPTYIRWPRNLSKPSKLMRPRRNLIHQSNRGGKGSQKPKVQREKPKRRKSPTFPVNHDNSRHESRRMRGVNLGENPNAGARIQATIFDPRTK
ncbi:hypothetical protein V6N13_142921 [Hibiscus sabdariffa]